MHYKLELHCQTSGVLSFQGVVCAEITLEVLTPSPQSFSLPHMENSELFWASEMSWMCLGFYWMLMCQCCWHLRALCCWIVGFRPDLPASTWMAVKALYRWETNATLTKPPALFHGRLKASSNIHNGSINKATLTCGLTHDGEGHKTPICPSIKCIRCCLSIKYVIHYHFIVLVPYCIALDLFLFLFLCRNFTTQSFLKMNGRL